MKTTLYALIFVALSAAPLPRATETTHTHVAARPAAQAPEDGARKVDEFGDILVTDWLARLDSFAIELQTNPGARGYIVAYIAPNNSPGWPLRRSQWARGYLVTARGFDAGQVQVVNGGYRDGNEHLYQLWIIAPGAKLPVAPFDFGAALAREKKAYLFDRYSYYDINPEETDISFGYRGYLDEKGYYTPFAEVLRQDPAARGCIIAYATRRQRRGSDRRLAAQVKLSVLKYHALGAERVVALGGGQRPQRFVELWIVPPGAELPKPTPAPSPKPRRQRPR